MSNDPDPAAPDPAAVDIDLAEPCAEWRRRLPEIEALCLGAARSALAAAGAVDRSAELSLVLADDALVRSLNRRWRGQDKPTNVLSFAAEDGPATATPSPLPRLLGDVVLAFETVSAEAAAQEKPLADHLRHLVVHGVLHLLGFDHVVEAEALRMEALETRILAGLGVPDPYRERPPREREATHG
jgi:probable rRNA maturation factor